MRGGNGRYSIQKKKGERKKREEDEKKRREKQRKEEKREGDVTPKGKGEKVRGVDRGGEEEMRKEVRGGRPVT